MSIKVNILTDFNGKGIEAAKKQFEQLEGKGQKAAFLIKKAAIPAAAALAGLAVAGKKFVAAGEESNSANQALLSLTRQTGLFGDEADDVAKRLMTLAEAQGRELGVSNLSIKAAQRQFLSFKNLAKSAGETGGQFDRATQAALDMAAVYGGDASSKAVQLGKALEDPVKGITALAKSGTTFTEQQKEQIKELVATNRLLEAQDLILGEIESQVGGTAAAMADDTAKMRESWAQASQAIGRALLPFLQKLVPIIAKLSTFVERNRKVFVAVGLVIAGLAAGILALNAALKLYKAIQTVVTGVTWAFNAAMSANPITLVVVAIAALVAAFVLAYKKIDWFRAFVDKAFAMIKDVIETVFGAVRKAVESTVGFITDVWDKVGGIIKKPFEIYAQFVKLQFDAVVKIIEVAVGILRSTWSVVSGIFTRPIDTIKSLWTGAGDAIKAIFDGISRAIGASFDAVVKTIKGAINIIIDGWNKIQFKIPGFKIGPVGYSGFTLGLPNIPRLAEGGFVDSPTLALIGEAGPEAVIPLEKMGSMGMGGGTTNVTINVSGGDPQAVVDALRRYMQINGTVPIRVS
jgi:hypothetical protein